MSLQNAGLLYYYFGGGGERKEKRNPPASAGVSAQRHEQKGNARSPRMSPDRSVGEAVATARALLASTQECRKWVCILQGPQGEPEARGRPRGTTAGARAPPRVSRMSAAPCKGLRVLLGAITCPVVGT